MAPHRLAAFLLILSLLTGSASARPPSPRQLQYIAAMQRVEDLWRQDRPDIPAIIRILLTQRGYSGKSFEYGYWWHMCHRELRLLDVSEHAVVAVAWSPDGRRLTARDEDGVVTVWSPNAGRPINSVRDAAEAERLLPEQAPVAGPFSITSADGATRVVVGAGGSCSVWDAALDGKRFEVVGHLCRVTCAAFSPDGKRFATGSEDGTVRVWDAASDRTTIDLRLARPPGWPQDFSPDDRHLLIGENYPEGFRICDSATGRALTSMTVEDATGRFSPDSRFVATYDGTRATVWDAARGKRTSELEGRWSIGSFTSPFARFPPDGHRLITASSSGNADVWMVSRSGQLRHEAHTDLDGQIWALDQCGKRAVGSANDGGTCVWELPSGRKLWQSHTRIQSWAAAFSQDRRWVAVSDLEGPITVFDARTGRVESALNGHTDFVVYVGWTPDSRRVVSGSPERTIRVWDPRTGQCLLVATKEAYGNGIAVSHDGRRIAFITLGRGVVILPAASDAQIRRWASLDRDLLRRMAAR